MLWLLAMQGLRGAVAVAGDGDAVAKASPCGPAEAAPCDPAAPAPDDEVG